MRRIKLLALVMALIVVISLIAPVSVKAIPPKFQNRPGVMTALDGEEFDLKNTAGEDRLTTKPPKNTGSNSSDSDQSAELDEKEWNASMSIDELCGIWGDSDSSSNEDMPIINATISSGTLSEIWDFLVNETQQAGKFTEPQGTEPKATEPKATEPKATEPKATEPKATEPKATEPKATEPKATEPQATEPQATESQATEPQATEPQATEPQATEPQATEPQATEPQATDGKWPRVTSTTRYTSSTMVITTIIAMDGTGTNLEVVITVVNRFTNEIISEEVQEAKDIQDKPKPTEPNIVDGTTVITSADDTIVITSADGTVYECAITPNGDYAIILDFSANNKGSEFKDETSFKRFIENAKEKLGEQFGGVYVRLMTGLELDSVALMMVDALDEMKISYGCYIWSGFSTKAKAAKQYEALANLWLEVRKEHELRYCMYPLMLDLELTSEQEERGDNPNQSEVLQFWLEQGIEFVLYASSNNIYTYYKDECEPHEDDKYHYEPLSRKNIWVAAWPKSLQETGKIPSKGYSAYYVSNAEMSAFFAESAMWQYTDKGHTMLGTNHQDMSWADAAWLRKYLDRPAGKLRDDYTEKFTEYLRKN